MNRIYEGINLTSKPEHKIIIAPKKSITIIIVNYISIVGSKSKIYT